MEDIDSINRFLQTELRKRGLRSISIAEASRWLDEAGLLEENPSNPGARMRRLLRNNLLEGQYQNEESVWGIKRTGIVSAKPC